MGPQPNAVFGLGFGLWGLGFRSRVVRRPSVLDSVPLENDLMRSKK